MKHSDAIKAMLLATIDEIAADPQKYAVHHGKDFTRNRKMGFNDTILMLLTMEADCIKEELYRYFGRNPNAPSKAAFYVKQSIYAFKGATDEAFDILDEEMRGKLTYYSLLNNYRTCSNLMRSMERYFFKWSDMGLLRYDEAVRPFNSDKGSMDMYLIEKKEEIHGTTLKVIEDALQDLEIDVRAGRKKVNEKTKVAVLFRGNGKAYEVAEMCKAHGMTVVLSSDRPFFLSQAVRDIYALVASYIFVDDPIYIYAGIKELRDAPYIKEIALLPHITMSIEMERALSRSVFAKNVISFQKFQELLFAGWNTGSQRFRFVAVLNRFLRERMSRVKSKAELDWLTGCKKNIFAAVTNIIKLEEAAVHPDDVRADDRDMLLFLDRVST